MGCHKNDHLVDEKLALVIELEALKDDFVAFRDKAAADKEAMEAEFDSGGDTLFNNGYDRCAFTYNICGSKPQILDGMPNPSVPLTAEFFANPCCPQARQLLLLIWILLLLVGKTVRRIVQPRPERRQFFQQIKRRRFFGRISQLSRV